jgi:choline dehydrogenase
VTFITPNPTSPYVYRFPFAINTLIRITQKTPEFQSFINDAVAFVNNSALFGFTNDSATFQAAVQAALDDSASGLVPTQYPEVVQGYKAVYNLTAQFMDQTAQLELLLSLISPGTVSIQAALQHPFRFALHSLPLYTKKLTGMLTDFSRGRLYINTSNPLDPIIIDPQYYSHFAG